MAIQETIAGVDVTATQNVRSFRLGQEVKDSTETVYRYVYAIAARDQYMPYWVDHRNQLHSLCVQSTTGQFAQAAVPQIAFAAPASGYTNRYGWAAVGGPFIASTTASITVPAALGINATGGFSPKATWAVSVIQGLVAQSTMALAGGVGTAAAGLYAANRLVPTIV
jgi:hypothetical protein